MLAMFTKYLRVFNDQIAKFATLLFNTDHNYVRYSSVTLSSTSTGLLLMSPMVSTNWKR